MLTVFVVRDTESLSKILSEIFAVGPAIVLMGDNPKLPTGETPYRLVYDFWHIRRILNDIWKEKA